MEKLSEEMMRRNEFIQKLNEEKEKVSLFLERVHAKEIYINIPDVISTIGKKNFQLEQEFKQHNLSYYGNSVIGANIRQYFEQEIILYRLLIQKSFWNEFLSPRCLIYNLMEKDHTNKTLTKIINQNQKIENIDLLTLVKEAFFNIRELIIEFDNIVAELNQFNDPDMIEKFFSSYIKDPESSKTKSKTYPIF